MQYLWKCMSHCVWEICLIQNTKRFVVWCYQCLNIYHAWYLERGVITNFNRNYIFLALKYLVFTRINSKNHLVFQANHMVYLEIFLLIRCHTLVGGFVLTTCYLHLLIVCQYWNVLERLSLNWYQLSTTSF